MLQYFDASSDKHEKYDAKFMTNRKLNCDIISQKQFNINSDNTLYHDKEAIY